MVVRARSPVCVCDRVRERDPCVRASCVVVGVLCCGMCLPPSSVDIADIFAPGCEAVCAWGDGLVLALVCEPCMIICNAHDGARRLVVIASARHVLRRVLCVIEPRLSGCVTCERGEARTRESSVCHAVLGERPWPRVGGPGVTAWLPRGAVGVDRVVS